MKSLAIPVIRFSHEAQPQMFSPERLAGVDDEVIKAMFGHLFSRGGGYLDTQHPPVYTQPVVV